MAHENVKFSKKVITTGSIPWHDTHENFKSEKAIPTAIVAAIMILLITQQAISSEAYFQFSLSHLHTYFLIEPLVKEDKDANQEFSQPSEISS